MRNLSSPLRRPPWSQLAAGAGWVKTSLVFTDRLGQQLDGVKVTRSSFYGRLKRAGLPVDDAHRVRFHDLRHTAATLMLERGVHPRVVAERLGHATPSLVMNGYGHVTERIAGEVDGRVGCRALLVLVQPSSSQRG
jgi:integrase